MVYGYAMARVTGAERIMLPVLDILQSIPVLGFLPGFVPDWFICFRSKTSDSRSHPC